MLCGADGILFTRAFVVGGGGGGVGNFRGNFYAPTIKTRAFMSFFWSAGFSDSSQRDWEIKTKTSDFIGFACAVCYECCNKPGRVKI